ncbi:enoyl-CoA hydratase/isomerase family protein [Alicycliphilus denitrificans]|uniref:Enoyl-CoA hydratase/isomerase family protein n=1 Tax=Alicycliphilus denitrificans TaxID=179636 RepID=A0A3R7FE35_9BURK|nr:enoyl-CoA hydratase-related protein [Alicycliphilus denitrificans]RKJ95656.1 enoyl-CoA hydratase/isomerase family protein [Alicycliphilus denitrificans]
MQAEDSEAWVLASRVGPVARIHLNRGDARNPLGAEMVQALSAAVGEASGQGGVRVILLTAAGPAFSAGGNLGNLGDRLAATAGPDGRDPIAAGNRRYGEFLTQLVNVPQVTVACVQGAAMGGGAGLACAVDIAIGSPEAKFGFPEAAIGLVPGQILPFVAARLGLPAARRLVLTGRRIAAAEAHRIGLLDYVAESHQALGALTRQVLESVLATAPQASACTKRMLGRLPVAPLQASGALQGYLDEAAELFARQMRSEAMEGVSAAREKRPARWNEAGELSALDLA